MHENAQTQIRRHNNGSIDFNHYARVGRALHGGAVRDVTATSVRRLWRALNPGRPAKRKSQKRQQPTGIFAVAD